MGVSGLFFEIDCFWAIETFEADSNHHWRKLIYNINKFHELNDSSCINHTLYTFKNYLNSTQSMTIFHHWILKGTNIFGESYISSFYVYSNWWTEEKLLYSIFKSQIKSF